MEPRAAQLRQRGGLGKEQEDQPCREGEPRSGSADRPGGVGGGHTLSEGAPAVYLHSFLLFWDRPSFCPLTTQLLPPNEPVGEGRREGIFSALPYLFDSFT